MRDYLGHTHRAAASVALMGTMVLTAACGSSTASGSTVSPAKNNAPSKASAGVLNWWNNIGDADWVKTLDPAIVTDSVSIGDIQAVNANLVKASYPSLKIVPDLATWKVSSNHKVYTFTIRKNARFNNGDPVTAQDAAWSMARSLLPATKSPVATTYLGAIVGAKAVPAGKATTISGVKVLNNKTLQITLTKPIAYFLGTLSYPTADVLDRKVMQGKAPASYLTNTCKGNVGAGPFEFVCRNGSGSKSSFYPGGHSPYMDFKPNPYYYGAKPKIKLHAPFYATTDEGYKAYEAGSLDGAGVPTADIAKASKQPGFSKVGLLETDYITPNSAIAPFNNVHCRLAVAYAIDREHITRDLLHGIELPLYDVLPPGLPGYFSDYKKAGVPYYNPTRAKAELAQCPGRLSNAVMTYQNTSSDLAHEYDAIKANLQAIGANVRLKPLTFNAWLAVVGQTMNATKSQENITENLWIDDYPDPQDWCDNLLHSGANYDIGNFSNPTYDKYVDAGNTEFNPSKRAQDYIKAQQIALKQGAWIGVGYGVNFFVLNKSRVRGIVNSPSLAQPVNNDWSKVSVS